jgi:chromosome segregation ATPase
MEIVKNPQGSGVHWDYVEAGLHGQIEEPGHKLTEKEIDNENLEAIVQVSIEQLEKRLQKTIAEKEKLKTALQEKDRDFTTLELKLRSKDRELRECIEERNSEKKRLESSFHQEKKFYDNHLQTSQEVQASLYELYKIKKEELQEKDGAIGKLEATLRHQYKELCDVRRERDSANERIQELENEKQMMELNNKEVESSVCSKTKKLAAVSVVVGVVAAAGWWLLS